MADGFEAAHFELDASARTLAVAREVRRWHEAMEEAPDSAARSLYLGICRGLLQRLERDETAIAYTDDPGEVTALLHRGELVAVFDHHVRRKTRALILDHVLSSPASQRPREARPEGTVGGGGAAAMRQLIGEAERDGLRVVRLQALNLRAYGHAVELGFHALGNDLPPIPDPRPEIHGGAPARPVAGPSALAQYAAP